MKNMIFLIFHEMTTWETVARFKASVIVKDDEIVAYGVV